MTHVKFDDDDDDAMEQDLPSRPGGRPTAEGSKAGLQQLHCTATVKVDLKTNNPAWVFRVVSNPSCSMLAASLSTNTVKLYSLSESSLNHLGNLQGHTGTISGLEFDADEPHMVYSSSTDGTVRAWDTRAKKESHSFKADGKELLCFGAQEQMVAAGGPGEVLFWDKRTRKAMDSLEDTHMQDVTQVKFCPSTRHHVFSGSIDGLVAVHDVRKPFADDDAFVAAINVTTSVEELGTYGAHHDKLWVRTGTETLHLWEWGRAAAEDQEGGEGAFAELLDAREVAAQGIQSLGGEPAKAFEEGVQYLTACHYDTASSQLLMLGGQEGVVAAWPVVEQASSSGSGVLTGASIAGPSMLLSGGHKADVRSVCWLAQQPTQTVCCVSGGEDGQLCLWSLDAAAGSKKGGKQGKGQGEEGPGPVRRHDKQQDKGWPGGSGKGKHHHKGDHHHKKKKHNKRPAPY